MSQFKSKGLKAARDGLLHYQKSDRPPYPLLYEMFAGRLEPEEVFLKIDQVDYPAKDRERVLFHAPFVGIYLELVQTINLRPKAFKEALKTNLDGLRVPICGRSPDCTFQLCQKVRKRRKKKRQIEFNVF